MPAVTGNFQKLLDPSLHKIYADRYKELEEKMPMIFNVETSSRNSETDSATTGFGKLQETNQLGALDYEDPIQMYPTVYTHLKYAKGFKVSVELWEDDQWNIIKKMPQSLAKATRRTTEFHAAKVLNNAFTTSATSYGDGKPLCSTVHPRSDGGTAQSNASSTSISLSEPNVETARLALIKQLNDKGEIIDMMGRTLVVPVDLEKTARIISESPMRPGTGNNDINVYEGIYKVIPWRYLTSTTAWFMLDDDEHLLTWMWRVKPEFKSDSNFDNDAVLYKVRARFSKGWSDWRGVWGSKGDDSAYSS